MPASSPESAHAARLLAFMAATTAVLEAMMLWAHHRFLAGLRDPASVADRSELLVTLEHIAGGGPLCAVALAGLGAWAARHYARAADDRVTRNLALWTAAALALNTVRDGGLRLFATVGPSLMGTSTFEWMARLRPWYAAGIALEAVATITLLLAAARHEQRTGGGRPRWVTVAGGLYGAHLLVVLFVRLTGADLRPDGGISLFTTVSTTLGVVAGVALASGLLTHARRLATHDPAHPWTHAAAGVLRYKDATALRVLLAVVGGAVLVLASSGLPLLVTLGFLGALGLAGLVVGLVQVAGLVRLADAPAGRRALVVALVLFGLGLVSESAMLGEIFDFVWRGGGRSYGLRQDSMPTLLATLQIVGMLTTTSLLLTFRRLARACAAPDVAARCTTMLVVLLLMVAALVGSTFLLAVLRVDPGLARLLLTGGAVVFFAAAIWLLVAYFGVLTRLHAAMARTDA